MADDGLGEVAVGLLEEEQVAVLAVVAQVGELVFVAAPALDLAGIGVEGAGLAEEVEA